MRGTGPVTIGKSVVYAYFAADVRAARLRLTDSRLSPVARALRRTHALFQPVACFVWPHSCRRPARTPCQAVADRPSARHTGPPV
jgi:hypothetical protein